MEKNTIRFVQESDAAEILSIYEPYVRETAISFEYATPSIDEIKHRITEISADYPYIVCLLNEKIVGYAYAHRHMERAAYQWNAELSIYIDKAYSHCGVGKILYSALIEILKLQNIQNIYGCITSSNENSIRFHEYFGFKKLGTFHSTGYKCGTWHDVVWLEKTIGEYGLEPRPFMPIKEINRDLIMEILNSHCNMKGMI